MEDNYLESLPHGKDLDAVSGLIYVGEAEQVLEFWGQLVENETIHAGTNFDLSQEIEDIDHCRKLCIMYDFLHRVMLYYYDAEQYRHCKELTLVEFKNYCRI